MANPVRVPEPAAHPTIARRTAVAGLLGVAVAATSGCVAGANASAEPRAAAPASPDAVSLGRAVTRLRTLRAEALTIQAARADLADALGTIVAHHTAQLAALGAAPTAPAPAGSASGQPATGPSTAPRPNQRPPGSPARLRALVLTEHTTAVQELTELTPTTPPRAVVLCRIAAACAADADLLARVAGLPVPAELQAAASPAGRSTAPQADALARLLAGEHAAVFAYGLITARISRDRTARARTLWDAHIARRDALVQRLRADGTVPPPALAAYDVGPPPTAQTAAALAARVEDGLAALAIAALAVTPAAARLDLAQAAVESTRRAVSWRGTTVALPG